MTLTHQLIQQMSVRQLQSLQILQMNQLELYGYLQKLAMENPLIDLDAIHRKRETDPLVDSDEIIAQYQWLVNSDYQNLYYHYKPENDNDPFLFIGNDGGLEETLQRHLHRQEERFHLDPDVRRILSYLIECLDDDGYLRVPKSDIILNYRCSEEAYRLALHCLQSMDPPGIGARTLSECLVLQLRSMGVEEQSCDMVLNHLEELAGYHFSRIAKRYNVSEGGVKDLFETVQSLNPKPGFLFAQPTNIPYVEPDVAVVERNGKLDVLLLHKKEQFFRINSYYVDMMQTCDDAKTKLYLSEKLRQAKAVDYGLTQRESALEQYLSLVVAKQSAFFSGSSLSSLTMLDIAEELQVNVSTVSRAIKNKYLICIGASSLSAFSFHIPCPTVASAQMLQSRCFGRSLLTRTRLIRFPTSNCVSC